MMFSRGVSSLKHNKSKSLSYFNNKRRFSTVDGPNSFSKLSNGVNVAAENISGETATIGVFVKTGSAFETESNNGVSNLFQRLAFKGTKNRNYQQIATEVENLGGSLKSYTTRDQSVFLAKVLKKDVPQAVDILSDVIQNSHFSAESIEQEKKLILNEIDNGKSAEQSAFDFLHSIAFQGSSFALTVNGTADSVNSISQSDLDAYVRQNIAANRISVVGVGALGDNFIPLVDSKFSSLKENILYRDPAPRYFGSAVTILDDSHHHFDAIVAFKGAAFASADHIPLLLIREIFGDFNKLQLEGDRSYSRINELIAKEQLADHFRSFNLSYNTTGLFGIYYRADGHSADDLTNFLITELVRLGNGVTEKELAIAKNRLKSRIFSYSGTTKACEEIGQQVNALGRRVSYEEYFSRIDHVDAITLQEVATKYFTHVEPVSVASGDIYHYPDYNQLCSWTYWNRL